MTPLGWVLKARVRRAQVMLESTTATIEEVAAQVGLESATTLRAHFHQPGWRHPDNVSTYDGRGRAR